MLGDRDDGGVERPSVQAAPPPVRHRLDLVRDDDVRVQLRVSRPRVPVIEGRRDDPDDVGLGDGAVPGIEAPARGGDLALQEGDYLGHGLMVRLDNQGLSAGVGDAPQRRDRLGDAEGEVVAGHRSPAASFELLGLDLGDRCRPLLVGQVGAQAGHPRRDSGADRRVLREGSSERLARDWVLAHPEQERELALGHGVVPLDGPAAHGMQSRSPAIGPVASLPRRSTS